MYNPFQLGRRYLQYYFTASNGRGHGVHSPFVFDFISNVLRDKKSYPCYDTIEKIRRELLQDQSLIEVKDFGAGSGMIESGRRRKVADIARTSLKPAKYAQLLYRIVHHYQPASILELGTSFGITTAYLASGNPAAKLVTLEGAPAIAAIARENFRQLQLENIELREGAFENSLPALLNDTGTIDLAFIDGNHRREPTIAYFEKLRAHAGSQSVFIFDDIHWSAGMEEAWEYIRRHEAVTLSMDLFFIGLISFSSDINHKQHFSIRF